MDLIAPADWRALIHWYEDVDTETRAEWAQEHATQIVMLGGQACVVISYPRMNGRVAVYDLDGGEIRWYPLADVDAADKDRDVEEEDFSFGTILSSVLCDEAADLWSFVDTL